MAVTLTGFGGVGEIGGNAFLLDDGRNRLFLDFGRRFGNDPHLDEQSGLDTRHMRPGWGDYFDEYLQPRSYRMAQDLAALQVIPPDLSLYRPDVGGLPGKAGVDGVLISHAHADHVGLIGLLKPDIPILMSRESEATVASLQATGIGGVANEFTEVRTKGYAWKDEGTVSTRPRRDTVPRRIQEAETADMGDWDIRQFAVDHSIHGARGSLLEGRDVTVAYTGDFRLHGRQRHETLKFLERAGGVDVLVAEGTNVHQGHKHDGNDDEQSVEGEILDLAAGEDGFLAIAFPPRDLDRFLSVWHVAKRLGRRLVIGTKQAHLLEQMRRPAEAGGAGRTDLPDPFRDPHLAVHLRNRGRGTIAHDRGRLELFDDDGRAEKVDVGPDEWDRVLSSEYAKWERPYLEKDNTVTSAEIGRSPGEWMFSISYWTITDLLDVFPEVPASKPGGLYIHSMTQPFNDDMELSDRKLRRWLAAFGLRYTQTHVSGHLSEDDLHHALDEIGAKRLVPIHSLHPDLTAEKYEARSGHKALLPSWGKPLPLA